VEVLFDQPVIPAVPYIIFSIAIAASFMLVLRSIGLPVDWRGALSFTLVSGFPAHWLLLSFASNVVPVAVGLFAASYSLWLYTCVLMKTRPSRQGSIWRYWLVIAAIISLLAISLGTYQSVALLFLMGLLARNLVEARDNRALLGFVGAGVAIFLTAILAWWLLDRVFLYLFDLSENFVERYFGLTEFLTAPIGASRLALTVIVENYAVDSDIYGRPASIALPLLTILIITVLYRNRRRFFSTAISIVSLLLVPFAFHFINGPYGLPVRSLVVIGFTFGILLAVALQGVLNYWKIGIVILSALLYVQLLQITGEYAAEERLTSDYDSRLAAEIYYRLDSCGHPSEAGTKQLAVYGYRDFSTIFATAQGSTTSGSFFEWDMGNPRRMNLYMQVLGYSDIEMIPPENIVDGAKLFADMPVFPSAGSVLCDRGVNLVKLSG
jgi:hypothetical protein